ncbi:MFS-type transporter SLC18B1-like [Antedon mediterranea]|uniref:MFS-type transporter SLC18B1-like n=1 Tax=Antedon mediterranea TaxID=105859 RepID=UPI003AF57BFF
MPSVYTSSFQKSYDTISDGNTSNAVNSDTNGNGSTKIQNGGSEIEINNGRVWTGTGSSVNGKLLIALIAISQLFLFMSWSIIAPFLPPEAEQKGASQTEIGFIFGIYSAVQFIVAPIWGKFIPVLGARFVFIIGYIITGATNVSFGFFDRIASGTPFVATCLLARAFQGVGTSGVFTAAMTMVAYTFPNKIGRLVGLLEVFTGIGLMIGPFIGGVLYEYGGFILPFVSLGCLMLLFSVILMFVLPKDSYTSTSKAGSFLSLLNIPGTWVGILSGFLAALTFLVLEPTLSLELEQFNLNSIQVGSVFLLLGLVYGFTSPFFGWLAEGRVSSRKLVIGGMFIAFVGYIILGPWPPLNLPNSLVLVCLGIVLISLAFGFSFAPCFQEILISARFNGMPSNVSTYGVLSGTFNSAFSLGSFVGPVVGGALVEARSFSFLCSTIALINLLLMVISIAFSLWEFNFGRGRRKYIISRRFEYTEIDDADSEEVRLLSNETA